MCIFKCILETEGGSHRCPDVLTKVVNWAGLLYLLTGIQSPPVSDPCVLSLGTWGTTKAGLLTFF